MTQSKIALVTGANRGLGKEIALQLAGKGLDVIITYNTNKAEAEEVVAAIRRKGQKAMALPLNVMDTSLFNGFHTQLSEVLSTYFKAQNLDFLINNAGFIHHMPFDGISEVQFDDMLHVHLKGPFFLTQMLLKNLTNGGGIVHISTGLTRFVTPGFATYAAMKTAVETLARYQAQELGARKIRVNVVAPGAIETDIMGGFVRDNKQMNESLAAQTALGRVGLPDDIGGVVAFLCTDDAKWVNAQRIEVSGGANL
jgi:NAD(P)-dependent dehydrogenase (short-subunit alcohol dehydrogenase family)